MDEHHVSTHYTIKDPNDKQNVTRDSFENFLRTFFPYYKPHGLVKYSVDQTFLRAYDIIEKHITNNMNLCEEVATYENLGEVKVTYGKETTEVELPWKNTERILNILQEKSNFSWIDKYKKFKHSV
jgi:hypothetical protein